MFKMSLATSLGSFGILLRDLQILCALSHRTRGNQIHFNPHLISYTQLTIIFTIWSGPFKSNKYFRDIGGRLLRRIDDFGPGANVT